MESLGAFAPTSPIVSLPFRLDPRAAYVRGSEPRLG
jgi:hypothetical protein